MKNRYIIVCIGLLMQCWGCGEHCHGDEGCEPDASHGASVGSGGGSGGTTPTLAEQYCNCMMTACHDQYHGAFGPESDEKAAREACLAEAVTLASAGKDVSEGDFVECRIHYCKEGKTNSAVCPSSIGGGECQ